MFPSISNFGMEKVVSIGLNEASGSFSSKSKKETESGLPLTTTIVYLKPHITPYIYPFKLRLSPLAKGSLFKLNLLILSPSQQYIIPVSETLIYRYLCGKDSSWAISPVNKALVLISLYSRSKVCATLYFSWHWMFLTMMLEGFCLILSAFLLLKRNSLRLKSSFSCWN